MTPSSAASVVPPSWATAKIGPPHRAPCTAQSTGTSWIGQWASDWFGLTPLSSLSAGHAKTLEQAAFHVTCASLNLAASTDAAGTDLAQLAHAYGSTLEELQHLARTTGGAFVPSVSAGEDLRSLNDHVGVLILSIPDGDGTTIATRLAVVKAEVPEHGAPWLLDHTPAGAKYFVKGYNDKLLDIEQLRSAIQVHTTPAPPTPGPNQQALRTAEAPGGQQRMETPFLSAVHILSDNSQLWARRSEDESESVHMPEPPNTKPTARKTAWANSEGYMSPGAGPLLANGTRKFQLDYNAVENRLMIFRNENAEHVSASGAPVRQDALLSQTTAPNKKKAPLWLSGPVMAEIRGVKHWELMGPADQHAGVKAGSIKRAISTVGRMLPDPVRRRASEFSNYVGSARPGARIIITTDDNAKHELKLTEAGIRMRMLNPSFLGDSGPIFGVDTPVQSDLDVYSYRGIDTGRHGSVTGRVHSETTMSTGETFLAAPLVKNRSGVTGSIKAGAESLARLAMRQPGLSTMNHGKFTHVVNTGLAAGVQFATVYLMSELNNLAKGGRDGRYVDGAASFSAVGAGDVTSRQLAAAAAGIIVAQECITSLFRWAAHMIPGAMKYPESKLAHTARFAGDIAKEFVRQETNYGIQHAMDLRPGTGWAEHGMTLGSSVLLTGTDWLRERSGSSANHPHSNALFTALRTGAHNVMRGTQVALNKPEPAPTALDFQEALLNRMVTRGFDQIVVPFINHYLNETGLLGTNARAFSRQTNMQSKALVPTLAVNIDSAMLWMDNKVNDGLLRAFGHDDFYRWFNLTEEESKQFLNRLELAKERAKEYMSTVLPPIPGAATPDHAADLADNVTNAGAVGMPAGPGGTLTGPQRQAIDRMYAGFDFRVARAGGPSANVPQMPSFPVRVGGFQPAAGKPGAMTHAQTELHPRQQRFSIETQRNFRGQPPIQAGLTIEDGPYPRDPGPHYLNAAVEQPTSLRYDNKLYTTYPKRTLGTVIPVSKEKMPRDQTTFSFTPQVSARPRTKAMERLPGIQTLLDRDPPPTSLDGRGVVMSKDIKRRIDLAVRHYTVESQHFHYPSRWDVTGTPKIQEISPGIQFAYNYISKPANVKGTTSKFVDPVETLYVNLGMVHAPKFPSEVYRAAVTEADYRPRIASEDATTRGVMSTGDMGVLTEIFSASMEPGMVASFGQGINGLGAVPREKSQRLVIAQETGINVTPKTDLVQAEIVMTQGAVHEIVHIDANAGRLPNQTGAENQDIGQVVYMRQVDTYAMEQQYTAVMAAVAPPVGTQVINPNNGHWYEYRPGDPRADANGLVFRAETRNYFLGRQLERAVVNPGSSVLEPAVAVARWYEPFTAEQAPRTMKDAIHAAILRGDAIVPMLNDAVLNSHHTYFRQKGGFYNDPPGPQRTAETDRVKANRARVSGPGGIVQTLRALPMNGKLNLRPELEQMVAQMMTHMLRERVRLVPIPRGGGVVAGASNLPSGTVTFDRTLDKIDLVISPLDDKNPKAPITIGVAPDGYYLMRQVDGQFVADTQVEIDCNARGDGKTVGNLMHAVLHAGNLIRHAPGTEYERVANPMPRAGTAPNLLQLRQPDGADKRVARFKATMERYFGTPYEKLERGVAEAADAINARLGIARTAGRAL